MSQFSEGKDDGPSDPTQKTLTNFVKLGDSSMKNAGDQNSLGSDINDHLFMDVNETSVSLGIHETGNCEFRDPFANCVQQLDDDNQSFSNKVREEKTCELSSNESAQEVQI